MNSAHAKTPTIQFVGAHDKNFSRILDNSISTLLAFSKSHQLKVDRPESFVEKVILYETKESFDKMISDSPEWPKGNKVPATYVGLGQKKKFHVVSWEAYRKIHPNESISDYQKLITHELTHLLHIAFLNNQEDDMGPLWFFEGFACFVAEQYPDAALPSKEQLARILSDDKRGNYSDYVSVFRTLAKVKPITQLLLDAKSPKFSDWAKEKIMEKKELFSVPLIERTTEPGKFVTDIEVLVDGIKKRFLLDTGAASSNIQEDQDTAKYSVLEKGESKGASGKAEICDVVQPTSIVIGLHPISKPKLKRCGRSILGLDLLGDLIFQVDLSHKNLNVLDKVPSNHQTFPIKRLKPGHVTIPMKFGSQKVDVLFDTGADTTVIDARFIKNHSDLFKLLRSEDGTDANGHKIESKIYECSSVEIGNFKLKNVEMAAFDFGSYLRESMEGSSVILGNNVISKAVWTFDLKNKKVAVHTGESK